MVRIRNKGIYLYKGREVIEDEPGNAARVAALAGGAPDPKAAARQGTISAGVLAAHNTAGPGAPCALKFDVLASHDITFVNIIQTARASGLAAFPVPYVLTNCHNSLCAVGGTINEDDHLFGLSAAKRYGGIYVPPHLAVIHSYLREAYAGCGRMILGSDSHTRYGSLGTLGVGEGGGELVKQLLGKTYDIAYPRVIAVYLTGAPRHGVGPQDAALALTAAVFKEGLVKNAALEFIGDGVSSLSADFRAGLDTMTTETACWSSIWETDGITEAYLAAHGRARDYRPLFPADLAYYDALVTLNLSDLKPMIALPFHPSNAMPVDEFLAAPHDILREVEKEAASALERPGVSLDLVSKVDEKGRVRFDQAIVAGCAGGTFENIMTAAAILEGGGCGGGAGNEGFSLAVYPGSQPILLEAARQGGLARLAAAGAVVRSAFCGPCFGAGDTPANNGLSLRHTTRNFPCREGAKPAEGQAAAVCLADARTIAATARAGGYLTSAEHSPWQEETVPYHFDPAPYQARVYNGWGHAEPGAPLRMGPNIRDWPPLLPLSAHLLVNIAAFITDAVTTTDELIPSGETSSFRSNPLALAEFTLSRKDPLYVGRAKAIRNASEDTLLGLQDILGMAASLTGIGGGAALTEISVGSAIFARRPGDGSAREQAASCQRVLGGLANFANEYATKRYRSNLINWGIVPFTLSGEPPFALGDWVFLPRLAKALRSGAPRIEAWVLRAGRAPTPFTLEAPPLGPVERDTLLAGGLVNYYRGDGK
ncbi:MAG: hydratase [Treponema sp.]|jgi:aconitate hydratase|nr:hydratase [Treponema sp.]